MPDTADDISAEQRQRLSDYIEALVGPWPHHTEVHLRPGGGLHFVVCVPNDVAEQLIGSRGATAKALRTLLWSFAEHQLGVSHSLVDLRVRGDRQRGRLR